MVGGQLDRTIPEVTSNLRDSMILCTLYLMNTLDFGETYDGLQLFVS